MTSDTWSLTPPLPSVGNTNTVREGTGIVSFIAPCFLPGVVCFTVSPEGLSARLPLPDAACPGDCAAAGSEASPTTVASAAMAHPVRIRAVERTRDDAVHALPGWIMLALHYSSRGAGAGRRRIDANVFFRL